MKVFQVLNSVMENIQCHFKSQEWMPLAITDTYKFYNYFFQVINYELILLFLIWPAQPMLKFYHIAEDVITKDRMIQIFNK